MTQTTRDAELAARFTESKGNEEQASRDGKVERRVIVAELLTHNTTREVAYMLGISVARVRQIMVGRK